jgi:Na+/melibiose symporter-like transporter
MNFEEFVSDISKFFVSSKGYMIICIFLTIVFVSIGIFGKQILYFGLSILFLIISCILWYFSYKN